ncbi:MAG: hypothetical protein AAF596_00935 [Planctomycetota bacterium]
MAKTNSVKCDQDKVWLTRWTWAPYMIPTVVLATALGGVLAWMSGQSRFATAPVGVLGIWAILHYQTPPEGMRVATIKGTRGATTLLWFLGAALSYMCVLAAVRYYWLGHTMHDPLELHDVLLFSPTFVLMFVGGYFADRQKARQQESESAEQESRDQA